jgi:hypothetical protein
MEECECNEKVRAEYGENRKECDMMDGADKEACEKKWREWWYAAAADCYPTECELKADAEYENFKKECLANGGSED